MVDFGECPSVANLGKNAIMLLYSSNRVMELSDSNTLVRSEITIKSEQLYYKVGHLDQDTNQIEWIEGGAYDYG